MHPLITNPDERERRLDEAIAAWIKANEQSASLDPREWLDRYPDLAPDLESFFAAEKQVGQVAAPWREAARLNAPPAVSAEAETLGRAGDSDQIDHAPVGGGRNSCEVRSFGDYELLAEIARGGMGVVFKARQTRLNRTVAVKMILAGEFADREDVRRFMSEAEAAAGLDHPGIVPVYESGEIDGQHFFSMGYVNGRSLAAVLAAGPLPPRRTAELLAQVADAVDYAHRQGVIHRDLKPGNILLDQDEHPRVTDFGLAKRITGNCGLTQTGQALGTPSYMPPEQASGKLAVIGPASDVYALGAVLYAMLTGRPPFQAANPLDTLLQVLEEEPVAPRQLNADVPRDLETIALKCLQKEPHKRYVTAGELADELRRYLHGEPIHARPVSRSERAWRWCRRNPLVAGLASAAAFFLLAGAGVSTYFAFEAEHRAFDAQQSAAAALAANAREQAQRLAETKAKNDARAAIDRYVDTVAEHELLKDERFQPLRKKLLSDALAYYQKFIASHEQADDRGELAKALQRYAFISAHTGSTDDARIAFSQAAKMYQELVAEQPNVGAFRNELAKTYNDLSLVLIAAGLPEEARDKLQRAIESEEKLVAREPTSASYRVNLARHYGNLGALQQGLGNWQAARGSYERTIQIAEKLIGEDPGAPDHQSLLAKTYGNLSLVSRQTGDAAAARESTRRAIEITKRLTADHPQVAEYQSDLAKDYRNLANLEWASGNRDDARMSFQRAIDLFERLVAENPVVAEYRSELAGDCGNLGLAQHALRDEAAARDSFDRAIRITEKLVAENTSVVQYRSDLADRHTMLGNLELGAGRLEAARTNYQRAFEIIEKLVEERPTNVALQTLRGGAFCNLANAIRLQGDAAGAVDHYRRGGEILEAVVREHPRNPTARLFLRNTRLANAEALDLLGRQAEAADQRRRAAELNPSNE